MNPRLVVTLLCALVLSGIIASTNVQEAHAVTVTIPITLNAMSGTTTPFAANFTISGTGCAGVLGHNGSPVTQSYTCGSGTTITVTAPADTPTSVYRFSDGGTSKQFLSCASGTCPTQLFTVVRQLKTSLTFSGIDSTQSVTVSKKDLGTPSTQIVNNRGADSYIKCDGIDDYGVIANSTAFSPSQFTISLWVEKESEPNDFAFIFSKKSTDQNGYSLDFDDTATHKPVLYLFNTLGGGINSQSTASSFPLFTWRHFTYAFDGSTLKSYENGALVGTVTMQGTYAQSANGDINMCRDGLYNSDFSNANLDDIRFYNRALTDAEVSALATGAWNSNGLVGAWQFREGSGSSVADLSGNARTMTLSGSPAWKSNLWSDQGSTVTVSNTVTVVTSQERFESYNNTSQRSFSVTAASSKTYVFQHEYNMIFRAEEIHEGIIFHPMPAATFTSSMTTSNGTVIPLTLDKQVTDDFLEPSGGRIWVSNGTSTWGDVYWRGLVVIHDHDQCSINGTFLNCDETVYSRHIGSTLGTGHHFRFGVDQATSDAAYNDYNSNTGMLNVTGIATSGQHTVKVEFLQSDYASVQSVFVNGVQLPGANYTITSDDTVSPAVYILTIDAHFSTGTFVITFASAAGGSPGGGGSSSGGSDKLSPIQPTVGSAIGLRIDPVIYQMGPGDSLRQDIKIYWQGNTVITIDSISFGGSPEWFSVGTPMPTDFVLQPSQTTPMNTLPLTVTLPRTVSGGTFNIPMTIKAHSGSSESTVGGTVQIIVGAPSDNLSYYATAIFFVALMGGVGYAVVRQGRRR